MLRRCTLCRPTDAELASPATPCLRLALLGSSGAAGLSAGARHPAHGGGTPDLVALRAGGSSADAVPGSLAVSGAWPSSMAPLKVDSLPEKQALLSCLQSLPCQDRSVPGV